jgi:proline dehydrogenase
MNNRAVVLVGKYFLNFSMFLHLPVSFMIKSTIFKQFCGGETMTESEKKIVELSKYNVKTILDYSVEGKESEKEFDKSCAFILKTVENASTHKDIPYAVFKMTGMARFALLQKVNEGKTLSVEEQNEYDRIVDRVNSICKKGFELDVPILIDAEESWIQNTIDAIVELMIERFNKQKAIVFNTVQLYRHDRVAYLRTAISEARENGLKYGIKLVRGAYMEKERERAEKMGYADPINKTKEDTDRDFNESIRICIENIDIVSVCCGTHNEKSSHYLVELMEEHRLSKTDPRIFFAQLLGMSDHISFNLSHAGYNVAKYVPFGPVYDVTPYLIRRTEENTSIAGQSSRELSLIRKELNRRKALKK